MSTSLQTVSVPDSDNDQVKESLRLIEDLKFFLATAPANWHENQVIRRYYLNHDEGFVSCVFWNNLYFITGTDIVRCIVYKFEHFGRKIIDRKKFEEGIFSDLRNLKCDTDAILEPPRSNFLEFLFKNACLRTQKKQKVFFWFNVPHDKLMADALERDIKKEKAGSVPTTVAHREPAKSFEYDENKSLYSQLADHISRKRDLMVSAESESGSRSPEYTSSGHKGVEETYQEEVSEIKEEDEEDDFPLDYFDSDTSNDYITIDPNYQSNTFEDSYDSYVDPSVFTNPSGQVSQLVHNNEYLIEQTQQVKTPQPPTAIPKPQYITAPPIMTASQEYFPPDIYQPPPSAKFRPPYYHEPQMYVNPEPEYWQQPYGDYQAGPGGYVFVNDPPNDFQNYFYMEQSYVHPQFAPSSRQQQISANMMKKKRQMQRMRFSNPVSRPNDPRRSLDAIIASKSTRVVGSNKDSESEPLIPTPESSITVPDHFRSGR